MSTRAVFLDAGGTLVAPRASVGEIYALRAESFGVRADATEIDRGFRDAFAAAPPLAFPDLMPGELLAREQAWWRQVVRRAFAEHVFDDFEAYFQSLYDDFASAEAWEVYADVIPVLENLRGRGVSLGVISNFDQRLVPLLEDCGLASYFDSFTFSSAVGYAKPDRRIFASALSRHGVEPEEALHAGDSEREDILGARAAGMKGVLVRTNGAGLEAVLDGL